MAKTLHCLWAPEGDEIYRAYHDKEWGVPEYNDRALFEKLILDGFQAGLSWRTILYKRDNFRKAFGVRAAGAPAIEASRLWVSKARLPIWSRFAT